jgi:3-isopropylmalate/(R)-2-methylmalate dehydratase large subunit
MELTISEKILKLHTKEKEIHPGMLISARVDLALGNDVTAPIAIEEFEKAGATKVFDRNKIALIPDHFAPNKDVKSAAQCKRLRDFAYNHRIKYYFEVGQMGVEHALIPDSGLVLPGDLVIGADSHTCTYGALGAFSTGVGSTDLAAAFISGECWFKVPESMKFIYHGKLQKWVGGKDLILFTIGKIGVDGALYRAMEFCGEVIECLPMDDRFSMCNMAIEAGAKSGIIEPDEITMVYIKNAVARRKLLSGERDLLQKVKRRLSMLSSDSDAAYSCTQEYDVSKLGLQVAFPHLPSNTRDVSEARNISIDQAVIGSCTNGRLSDLRIASKVLRGKKVNSRVRLIVIPATQEIYLNALKEGLIEVFIKAGGAVSTPTCGPCLGGHMGILAEGERAISTTNRNFVGRMGHTGSEVYLSNAAVAAASAIKGRIAHPDDV